MAKKADNKPAATERVTFTSGAADRIAKVVRTVEGGNRDCGPLTFGTRTSPPPAGSAVKFAFYTATTDWVPLSPIGTTAAQNLQTIRFCFSTAETAVCINHLAWLPRLSTVATAAVRVVVVTKEAGQWRLIGAQA